LFVNAFQGHCSFSLCGESVRVTARAVHQALPLGLLTRR
jgi:hypothetical protein